MKIIIGLGNPGKRYEQTRHNIGYMALDFLHHEHQFDEWETSKFDAIISTGYIGDEKVILAKPTTFMNLSGQAVAKMVNFYKLDISSDILILSDDIDMDFGKVRMRTKGSHGGQNGLRNTIERLGTNEFYRIKIGIGRHSYMSVSDWVLSKITTTDKKYLEDEVFERVSERVEEFVRKSL